MKKKNPAAVKLGKIKTAKNAAAVRENGRKGGRPKKCIFCHGDGFVPTDEEGDVPCSECNGSGKSKASETLLALAKFNSWRRGDETIEMPPPSEIGAAIDDAVNLLRRYDDIEQQLYVNHERAEGIIRAREQTIKRLQEEIGLRGCPQCMAIENMSRDMATLHWQCRACGKGWDSHYIQGWSDGRDSVLPKVTIGDAPSGGTSRDG